MKRLLNFLLGCTAGAAVALLMTPKSGREWREQLLTAPRQRLLARGDQDRPPAEATPEWSDAGVPKAVVREQPAVYEEPASAGAEEAPADEDLSQRVAETRMALEAEIARALASVAVAATDVEPVVAEGPADEAEPKAEAEPVAEDKPAAYASPGEEPASELPHVLAAGTIAEEVLVAPEPLLEEVPAAEGVPLVEPVTIAESVTVVEPVTIAESVTVVEPVTVAEPVFETGAAPVTAAEAEPAAARDSNIDQAEMRRRIEETRARLKAKAFDAMMSGESALLGREKGDKPVPYNVDVEVDKEVANTIDESLSQEEF